MAFLCVVTYSELHGWERAHCNRSIVASASCRALVTDLSACSSKSRPVSSIDLPSFAAWDDASAQSNTLYSVDLRYTPNTNSDAFVLYLSRLLSSLDQLYDCICPQGACMLVSTSTPNARWSDGPLEWLVAFLLEYMVTKQRNKKWNLLECQRTNHKRG